MRTWPREPMAHKQNTQQMVKNTINIHLKPNCTKIPGFTGIYENTRLEKGEWGYVYNYSFEKMEK